MRRTGAGFGWIITALIFAIFFFQFLIAAAYTGELINRNMADIGEDFATNVMGEKVMEAPCATKSRGIFYASSVRSGDFVCIEPHRSLFLHFDFNGESYTWQVRQSGADEDEIGAGVAIWMREAEEVGDQRFSQQYHVAVYDAETEEYHQANLEVASNFRP